MADLIIVIANGRLVEKGSHNQLIKKKGVYSSLFKMQAEGFK
jgi:ABC-type transport system involved in Fe-S cluster assembly fused permease/ATPase subunit